MARQIVNFTEVNNPLLKFMLEDGTELMVKVALMRVIRTDEKLPDGQFRHEFNFQHMIDQIEPEKKIDPAQLVKGDKK